MNTPTEMIRMLDESIKKRQQDIEKQQNLIDESHAVLSDVKSRRNLLIPIFSLPPEILGIIFAFVKTRELDTLGNRIGNPLDWIGLTHICRPWRGIAVDSPNLWVDLPIGKPKWVEEMLRRSKERGLIIDTKLPLLENKISGMVRALQDSHRIEELSIYTEGPNAWSVIQQASLLSLEILPRLKRFRLAGSQESESPFVISDLILRNTKQLRQLELTNCLIQWTDHPLLQCSLTHLKLNLLWPNNMPNGQEFMTRLQDMPNLQVLELVESLPYRHPDGASTWGHDRIHLAHLQSLRIHSLLSEIEDFFHCVTFPPTAVTQIVALDQSESRVCNALFELARSYSNAGPDTIFQSVILRRMNPFWGICIELYTEALQDLDIVNHVNAVPRLEMQFPGSDDWAEHIMSNIFISKIALVRDIQHLYLADNIFGIGPTKLARTLGKLPRLHSVVASGPGARTFFDAMHIGFETMHIHHQVNVRPDGELIQISRPMGTGKDFLYFPCVSSIYLHDTPFVDSKSLDAVQDRRGLSTDMLQDVLIQRCELGGAIDRLVLRDCRNVSQADIKALQEIVVDVDWDTLGA